MSAPRIRCRATTAEDVAWVRTVESQPDVRPYVHAWPENRHVAAIADPTMAHWVVEEEVSGRAVGFVILAGVGTPSVELVRIAVSEPGRGFGKATLRTLVARVLEDWRAERLWLDVYADNERALGLYRSQGFEPPESPRAPPTPDGTRDRRLLVLERLAAEVRVPRQSADVP